MLPENKVTVNDIVSKLAVKVSGNIMYGVSPGLQVNTLINSIVTSKGSAKVYDGYGNEKTNGILATYDKIVIEGTSDSATYYLAVRGDVNGDGNVDFNDMVKVNTFRLNKSTLEEEFIRAADVTEDGVVDFKDLVEINKFRLKRITKL